MRKEYDIKKLKMKRRGILPKLQCEERPACKVRITISLDKEIIDYFKAEARRPGAFPYQTQINQALRKIISKERKSGPDDVDVVKQNLLNDIDFIHQMVDKIKEQHKHSHA